MRDPTIEEKRAFAGAVVDTAIIQAAECSGLRKWLVEETVKGFMAWEQPNAAEIMLHGHSDLIEAFALIVDPDAELDEPFSPSSVSEYPYPAMPWLEERDTP